MFGTRYYYVGLRAALLASTALVAAGSPAATQDATWLTSPVSNEYDAGPNWSGGTMPSGTAYFGTSNTTSLSVVNNGWSGGTYVLDVGGWTFNAGASNYTFDIFALRFTGTGITINGGSATLVNNDNLLFLNNSTAGSAAIINNYLAYFLDNSTAGSATIANNDTLYFQNNSTAGNATITNNYNYTTAYFGNFSTAGNATITNNGALSFHDNSTAGNAAIINNAGGSVDFSPTTGLNGDNKISAGSIAGAGSYNLGANELTVGSNNLSTEVSGVIAGTGGSLVKVGTGTLTLSGNNTFTGGVTLNAGTLGLANNNALGTGVLTTYGGTVAYANGVTISNAIDLRGSTTLDVAASSATQAGAIGETGGAFGIVKTGAGTLILSGANSYSGGTTVNAGTLKIAGAGKLGSNSGATTVAGGTLDLGGTTQTQNGGVTLTGGSITSGTLSSSGLFDVQAGTIDASLAGSGRLTKSGTGTVTLSGSNIYTGGTAINDGTLQLAGAGTLGGNSGATTVAGGTLDLGGTTQTQNGGVTLTGGRITNGTLSSSGVFDVQAGTIDANLTGSGALTKTGTGTLTLSGASTYTGGTTINGGTLQLGSAGGVGSILGTVNVGASGTFSVFNADTSGINSISNDGTTIFHNASSAGSANISNGGTLNFNDTSTAGTATITNSSSGTVLLSGNATAGSAIITTNNLMFFYGSSTAGSATITNNNWLSFNETSTADSATLTNNRWLYFYNNSTAGSATITNSNLLVFRDDSTAGNASITSSGTINFVVNSTAGSAAITNTGQLTFDDTTTAGSATITNNSGGTTKFLSAATAGNAQLINNGAGAVFDFSGSSGPNGDHKLSAGSIAGNGTFYLGANALTVGGNNLSTTVSGVIADGGYSGGAGGSLVKTGTGTLTLSAANTYAGGTTFAGGAVSVSSDANLGDLAGSLTFNGGTLQITGTAFNATARTIILSAGGGTFDIADAANNFVISQNLGGGALSKSGAGTLTLTGAGSFSGATVSAGTLTFNANATAGNAAITNNAQLTFDTSATAGSATITNNQQVLFTSSATAGTATIANNNQLTFDTNATAGSAVIINVGHTVFSGNSTPGNAQLFNSTPGAVFDLSMTSGPNGDNKLTAGSLAGSGTFSLGGNELTVGNSNLSTNVTGVIADGGSGGGTGASMVKTGTGTLTLSGVNTYTGATTIDGGTLAVNGSIVSSSGVTVNAGGTLGGNGIVGNTLINGGTLSPGNSIGLLTVQGSLAFTAAASYMVELSPSDADRVNVTGAATLGGASVKARFAPASYIDKKYTILNAGGGVTGTFGSLVVDNLPSNFGASLSYDAHNAYLDLVLQFAIPGGITGNPKNVGNALTNYFNANGTIPVVFALLSAPALSQAAGETATGSQQSTFNAMTQFMGVMTDPYGAGREAGASGAQSFAAAGEGRPSNARVREAYATMANFAPRYQMFEPGWNVWAGGFGGSQTTDGSIASGSHGATSRLFGTAAGADYWFSAHTLAGFALAGGGTNFSVVNGGTGRSDLFQAGAFVRHHNGPAYLSAALAYGWQDVTTDRTVTIAGIDRLQARFQANTFAGRVEGGYRFATPWMGITPYAAGQVTSFQLPAYAESVLSGANTFALSYGAKTVTASRSELGLRTDRSWAVNDAILTLRGRAAWAHDFNPDRAAAATFQTLPGASFVVNGAAQARDSALTTASAEMKWRNGFSLGATFEGEFSNVTRSYGGKGIVRYVW